MRVADYLWIPSKQEDFSHPVRLQWSPTVLPWEQIHFSFFVSHSEHDIKIIEDCCLARKTKNSEKTSRGGLPCDTIIGQLAGLRHDSSCQNKVIINRHAIEQTMFDSLSFGWTERAVTFDHWGLVCIDSTLIGMKQRNMLWSGRMLRYFWNILCIPQGLCP